MPKRNVIWVVAILAAAVVTMWVTRKTPPTMVDPDQAALEPVVGVYRLIDENYYRPVDITALRRGAVEGMVGALDDFSSYIPSGGVAAFEQRMMGLERGLGLRVDVLDGAVTVVCPVFGSPAHRAGVLPGDRLIAVDSKDVAGLSIEAVRRMLEGQVGTTVELKLRTAAGRERTVELERKEFAVETVGGLYRDRAERWVYTIDPRRAIACLRVTEFVQDTGELFQRALRQIPAVKGLVLDLRDNPGGLLPAGVALADVFLREGPIVTVLSGNGRGQRYEAHADGTYPELPVVVLINAATASAAEIVAGALKMNDRAVLIGTRTHGKGCVQTMFRLSHNLGQVNLTTSEFYFGEGERITRRPGCDVWGVEPHEQVTISAPRQEELSRLRITADVVPLPEPASASATAPATGPGATFVATLLARDPQLARAVALLADPKEMADILTHAAQQREKRKALATRKARGDDD